MEIEDILQKIIHSGLGVDIDETLSWTVGYWMKEMQKLFGNPENLSVQAMVAKYRYTQNVPYWQSKEALAWVEEKTHSNELQMALPLIEGADFYLNEIHKIIPVAAYITIRPEAVYEGTVDWLRQRQFPEAPVICRPNDVESADGTEWKGTLLGKLYPMVQGMIDDNVLLLRRLPRGYPGTIFVYDCAKICSCPIYEYPKDTVPCRDWKTVYEEVRKRF